MRERDISRIYLGSLELLGKHADPNAGEMALPMMMTQDDRSRIKRRLRWETLCKALWHGYLDCVVQSVYPKWMD